MTMSSFLILKASRFFAGALLAGLLVTGCSKDDPVASKSLCAGESGVGLRVEGRAEPLDVCVSDTAVDALLTSENHYDVSAQLSLDDGSLVQVRIVFTRRPTVPVSLRLVNSSSEALSDPSTAYVYYEEAPGGGTPIQSSFITGGSFRVTFNDDTVAVGTMENVAMDMTDVLTGDPSGERRIAEGFFSVTVTPPAATGSSTALSRR
ncbi:MAG TPA: hypothetical protein VFH33_08815 [Candidatus Krumholzibacteria bacterium]|nr:hypothetical protein [Candidatus Krumholzibacteria bacterium]